MTEAPKRHWLEYASTASLLLISALSLGVAVGTEDANRKMVAASSWPFLQVNSSNADGAGHSVLRFTISNGGVGPAKIKSFEIFWRGKAYPDSAALLKACCGFQPPVIDLAKIDGSVPPGSLSTARMMRTVIRAGDFSPFITLPVTMQNATAWRKLDKERRANIRFRLCYCSVFDECWTDDFSFSGDSGPNPVSACTVPKVPYDQ